MPSELALVEDSTTSELLIRLVMFWLDALDQPVVGSVQAASLNIGSTSVPFGYAAHPYLTVGEATVDDVVIRVPAERYLAVDDRLLPVDLILVEGRDEDLRSAAPLGDRRFDTALTGLRRDADERWRARLERGDRWAELWAGQGLDWIQVFTGNDLAITIIPEPSTLAPTRPRSRACSSAVLITSNSVRYSPRM